MVSITADVNLVTSGILVGAFGCAAYVAWCCVASGLRRKLFAQHMLMLSSVEMAMPLWHYFSSVLPYGTLLYQGDPPWCRTFLAVWVFLGLVRYLSILSILLTMVGAIRGSVRELQWLHYSPVANVVSAFIFATLLFFWGEQMPKELEGVHYCVGTGILWRVSYGMTGMIFAAAFVMHFYFAYKLKRRAPNVWRTTRERHCIQIGNRYLLAFFCSYFLWGIRVLVALLTGATDADTEDVFVFQFWLIQVTAWLADLHPVFNLIALIVSGKSTANVTEPNAITQVQTQMIDPRDFVRSVVQEPLGSLDASSSSRPTDEILDCAGLDNVSFRPFSF